MKTALIAGILAALTFTLGAQAKVSDPRKCSTYAGLPHPAYSCARDAAVATTRLVMARHQQIARWQAPTFCTQGVSLLRWNCTTFLGANRWTVAVRWWATSTGWHRYATVKQTAG